MAFTARNGKRITKANLKKWNGQIERGERSRIEVERTELGDQTGRGKTLLRVLRSEGILD